MPKTPEMPRDRMARMFGLGEFGKTLAEEILREYGEQIAQWLELAADRPEAAKDVREFNGYGFE